MRVKVGRPILDPWTGVGAMNQAPGGRDPIRRWIGLPLQGGMGVGGGVSQGVALGWECGRPLAFGNGSHIYAGRLCGVRTRTRRPLGVLGRNSQVPPDSSIRFRMFPSS